MPGQDMMERNLISSKYKNNSTNIEIIQKIDLHSSIMDDTNLIQFKKKHNQKKEKDAHKNKTLKNHTKNLYFNKTSEPNQTLISK